MKQIDVDSWYRRDVFRFFSDFDQPHFSLTANVDTSAAHSFCSANGLPFNLALLHLATKAANGIPEFRTRLVDGKVVEFPVVHASQPVLLEDDGLSFCFFEARETIGRFCEEGKAAIARARETRVLDEHGERIDQLFFSVIPWVSFTSFKNAQRSGHTATVPRLVFGKTFDSDGKRMMPVSVEVHHALMDGIHVGRFYGSFQELLDAPV